MIAQLLLNETGQSWTIGLYIALLSVVSFTAVCFVRKSDQGRDLHIEEVHEEFIAKHPGEEVPRYCPRTWTAMPRSTAGKAPRSACN